MRLTILPDLAMRLLLQGTLVLQWPSSAYGPLRKLGELCLSPDPKARPTADQVRRERHADVAWAVVSWGY